MEEKTGRTYTTGVSGQSSYNIGEGGNYTYFYPKTIKKIVTKTTETFDEDGKLTTRVIETTTTEEYENNYTYPCTVTYTTTTP
jgi:hypothetical protein